MVHERALVRIGSGFWPCSSWARFWRGYGTINGPARAHGELAGEGGGGGGGGGRGKRGRGDTVPFQIERFRRMRVGNIGAVGGGGGRGGRWLVRMVWSKKIEGAGGSCRTLFLAARLDFDTKPSSNTSP